MGVSRGRCPHNGQVMVLLSTLEEGEQAGSRNEMSGLVMMSLSWLSVSLRGRWCLAGLMAVPRCAIPGARAGAGSHRLPLPLARGVRCRSSLIPSINQRLSEPLINKTMA